MRTPAGLVIGPRILNMVRKPSDLRGPIACFIALWCDGANIKPTPNSLIQRATCSEVSAKLTPAASNKSALPELEETPRLPCFATVPPAAATTNDDAVETLNKLAPSPPVPTISTAWSCFTVTPVASSRITVTAPTISSMLSLFIRSATKKAPICASSHWPVMIKRITSIISAVVKSCRSTTRASAWRISIHCSPISD